MYAIIESCGKQYKVAEGDVVFFEKLDAEEGKKVTFDKVILVSEDGKRLYLHQCPGNRSGRPFPVLGGI